MEDRYLNDLKVCPYCKASLQEALAFSELDSLDKAIYTAIQAWGKDILSNPRQFSAYLMDTAQGLEKEVRLFSKTVNDYYMGQIRTAFEQNLEVAEYTINKLRRLFVEDEWLAESAADMLCQGIYGAIRYANGIESTQIANAEIGEYVVVPRVMPTIPAQKQTIPRTSASGKSSDADVKYKCSICGYLRDKANLPAQGEKCPVCGAILWVKTDEATQGNGEKAPAALELPKTKPPYLSNVIWSYLEDAEKCLSENRVDEALDLYRKAVDLQSFIGNGKAIFCRNGKWRV